MAVTIILCCAQPDQSGPQGPSQVPEANPAFEALRPYHGSRQN